MLRVRDFFRNLLGHSGILSDPAVSQELFRLKTSHGTYLAVDTDGKLLHLQVDEDLKCEAVESQVSLPIPHPGVVELEITEGPLSSSIMVVLPEGFVAFRRGQLYLCANPNFPELYFDRREIAAWERFIISTTDGSVVRRAIIRDDRENHGWIDLEFIPTCFWPSRSALIDEFVGKTSATFDITENEYVYAPITLSFEDFRYFQEEAKTSYPAAFGRNELSSCCIRKEKSKYIVMTDRSYGVIFDKSGFCTDPAFLPGSAPPKFLKFEPGKYSLNFKYLEMLPEENVSVFVFYSGNHYNYYHWWCECLLKLEIFVHCFGYIPTIIIWNERPTLTDWHIKSLELFGANIVYRTSESFEVVRVQEVIWADRTEICFLPGFLLRNLRERILNTVGTSFQSGDKIYIKRRGCRTVLNDSEIDNMLKNKGYKIIYNEDYSQVEQIEIFKCAGAVIAVHGAGLTNILFMNSGSIVIELMPSAEIRTFFWLLAEKLRHKYGVLICHSVDGYFNSALEVNALKLSKIMSVMESHSGFSSNSTSV